MKTREELNAVKEEAKTGKTRDLTDEELMQSTGGVEPLPIGRRIPVTPPGYKPDIRIDFPPDIKFYDDDD